MAIDIIGDFLTIIRNGLAASKSYVLAPYSRMKFGIAQILKEEGFIKDVVVIDDESPAKKRIKILLKYVEGESVIHKIERLSKPSRRRYVGAQTIKPVIGKLGVSILTTNQGIVSHKRAKELGIGGEVVCTVW